MDVEGEEKEEDKNQGKQQRQHQEQSAAEATEKEKAKPVKPATAADTKAKQGAKAGARAGATTADPVGKGLKKEKEKGADKGMDKGGLEEKQDAQAKPLDGTLLVQYLWGRGRGSFGGDPPSPSSAPGRGSKDQKTSSAAVTAVASLTPAVSRDLRRGHLAQTLARVVGVAGIVYDARRRGYRGGGGSVSSGAPPSAVPGAAGAGAEAGGVGKAAGKATAAAAAGGDGGWGRAQEEATAAVEALDDLDRGVEDLLNEVISPQHRRRVETFMPEFQCVCVFRGDGVKGCRRSIVFEPGRLDALV